LVVTIYYFGFAKKENGKTARWQDGKGAISVLPSCPLAFLPLYHFAIHIINKVLDGEHPYWGGYVNEC
jgi:hypothetical protein